MKKIQFYGAVWCADCVLSMQFLDENKINYIFHDIDTDKKADKLVRKINNGMRSIPTIIFPDGSILVEPSNQQLFEKIELERK